MTAERRTDVDRFSFPGIEGCGDALQSSIERAESVDNGNCDPPESDSEIGSQQSCPELGYGQRDDRRHGELAIRVEIRIVHGRAGEELRSAQAAVIRRALRWLRETT
jgi:hypothetical protein